MKEKKMILIDGYSLLYRMFYGVRPMSTKNGEPTNVVYGFSNLMLNVMEQFQPDYIGVAFDEKKPTFRHDAYEDYKAGRLLMPEDLQTQVKRIFEMLEKMKIKAIALEGYEADDLIGTIAKESGKKDVFVQIVTGDRDAFQLVDENIQILYTKKGISEVDVLDENEIAEMYGIEPGQLVDVKSLMGDKSDNIPGVKGVGEKTALQLIKKYHSLENVYENIDEIKGKVKEKLERDQEDAFLSKRLGKIVCDVPIDYELDEYRVGDYRSKEVVDFFNELECYSIVKRLTGEESKAKEEINVKSYDVNRIETEKTLKDCVETVRKSKKVFFDYFMDEKGDGDLKTLTLLTEKDLYYVDVAQIGVEKAMSKLGGLFEETSLKKTGHHIKRLMAYLMKFDTRISKVSFDTFLGAYLLDPSEQRYEISDLAGKHLNKNIPNHETVFGKGKKEKDYQEVAKEDFEQYMILKTQMLPEVEEKLMEGIAADDMNRLLETIELPLMEVLASFEYEGFTVDVKELKRLDKEFDEKIQSLIETIHGLAGEEFNVNSPKQLGKVLFETLKLPVIKKTKTGYSTNVEVLEKLKNDHPIIEEIMAYRSVSKLSSTYIKGFLDIVDPNTNKIYSTFHQALTATGRISSSDPNLQNIPVRTEMGRGLRKIFVASKPENYLVDADYSQIELRVLAHISEDPTLMESFQQEEDIHQRTASEIFSVPLKEVTPQQRSYSKAINFGLIYGKQAYGLSQDLNISRKEAQEYIDTYFGRYPKVEAYMKKVVEEAKKDGYVTTIFGRRRYIPQINSRNGMLAKSGERLALNTPIQGSAADIMKIAMIKVYQALKEEKLQSKLILTVHDELIIDCEKDELETVKDLLKTNMEDAVDLKVPITVDVSYGSNW
ncbi:MAG TPA: DNA polymerase I, partial [Eubacteriaceae bacterium]|nr:DNA polymerase I [Eubacteriaceae bacterium]